MMEETTGHPPEATPVAPEPQPAPPPAPASEGLPVEDIGALKARLDDKDKFIGRQTNEIGDLRSQLDYLRGHVEALERTRQVPEEEEPTPEEPRPKFNWEDPEASVEQIVQIRLAASMQTAEQQRSQESAAMRAQIAYTNFNNSWAQAVKDDPRLYEGIEGIIQETVKNSYKGGILNEYNITPQTIRLAAQMVRLNKGEIDRLSPQRMPPVQPTVSETPTARPMRNQEEVSVEIDDRMRQYGRDKGLSDKQIEDFVKKELDARMKGQNAARLGYGG